MTKPPDFGAMCANELTERDQGGLRPKRLKFVETKRACRITCFRSGAAIVQVWFWS